MLALLGFLFPGPPATPPPDPWLVVPTPAVELAPSGPGWQVVTGPRVLLAIPARAHVCTIFDDCSDVDYTTAVVLHVAPDTYQVLVSGDLVPARAPRSCSPGDRRAPCPARAGVDTTWTFTWNRAKHAFDAPTHETRDAAYVHLL
jgi:hypothetical protein